MSSMQNLLKFQVGDRVRWTAVGDVLREGTVQYVFPHSVWGEWDESCSTKEDREFILDFDNPCVQASLTNLSRPAPLSEREQFEEWYWSAGFVSEAPKYRATLFHARSGFPDQYRLDTVQSAWETWKGCTALHQEQVRELRDALGNLVNAARYWASQEDGIPDFAAKAFTEAMTLLGWSFSTDIDSAALALREQEGGERS